MCVHVCVCMCVCAYALQCACAVSPPNTFNVFTHLQGVGNLFRDVHVRGVGGHYVHGKEVVVLLLLVLLQCAVRVLCHTL